MAGAPDNPDGNAFKAGVDAELVLDAVERSGYPLQTVIAARLRGRGFRLEEEWAYVDSDSEEERTLDICAHFPLKDGQMVKSSDDRGLAIGLCLLIECKQSELPYIAFEAVSGPQRPSFPFLAGLPRTEIQVRAPGDDRFRRVPVLELLRLDGFGFARVPPIASSLSAASRKSKKLELSGDLLYRGLVHPLTKAAIHYRRYWKGTSIPASSGGGWSARLAIPVAVVDAPLVLARVPDEKPVVSLVPWIRVTRRHTRAERDPWRPDRPSMIDLVHKDFFDDYERRYVRPFAHAFERRLHEQQEALFAGGIESPEFELGQPLPGYSVIREASIREGL